MINSKVMTKKYPVARPRLGVEEERAVLKVLRSGTLSMGPYTEEFEKSFARFVGTKYACAVSSGTAGLHLALIAAGIKAGDEIITSPFSFIASANSILYVGASPVFVDIDPLTYNMDPARIEAAITKRTKAIMVVHIFGQPCDMRSIEKIAKKHKLPIIEDACESLGAMQNGRKTGTFGVAGVFAFYANKQITTGEGGMITTDDKRVYELCASLRNQGRAPNMQWLDHDKLGYNYRIDEMSAALGAVQMKRIARNIRERQKIAGWYTKHLTPYADIIGIPRTAEGNIHTWFVYVIQILKTSTSRDDVIRRIARKGVATKPYLPSIHLFSFYKSDFDFKKGDFPISESVSERSMAQLQGP